MKQTCPLKSQAGAFYITFLAVLAPVVFLIGAFILSFSMLYVAKSKIQNAADLACLSAAKEYRTVFNHATQLDLEDTALFTLAQNHPNFILTKFRVGKMKNKNFDEIPLFDPNDPNINAFEVTATFKKTSDFIVNLVPALQRALGMQQSQTVPKDADAKAICLLCKDDTIQLGGYECHCGNGVFPEPNEQCDNGADNKPTDYTCTPPDPEYRKSPPPDEKCCPEWCDVQCKEHEEICNVGLYCGDGRKNDAYEWCDITDHGDGNPHPPEDCQANCCPTGWTRNGDRCDPPPANCTTPPVPPANATFCSDDTINVSSDISYKDVTPIGCTDDASCKAGCTDPRKCEYYVIPQGCRTVTLQCTLTKPSSEFRVWTDMDGNGSLDLAAGDKEYNFIANGTNGGVQGLPYTHDFCIPRSEPILGVDCIDGIVDHYTDQNTNCSCSEETPSVTCEADINPAQTNQLVTWKAQVLNVTRAAIQYTWKIDGSVIGPTGSFERTHTVQRSFSSPGTKHAYVEIQNNARIYKSPPCDMTVEDQTCPAPTLNFSGPANVCPNERVNLSWNSTNANTCVATVGGAGYPGTDSSWSGNKTLSGTFTSAPLTQDTRYNLTCANACGGNVVKNVPISVRSDCAPPPPSVTCTGTPNCANKSVTWNAQPSNIPAGKTPSYVWAWGTAPPPVTYTSQTGPTPTVFYPGSFSGNVTAALQMSIDGIRYPEANCSADLTCGGSGTNVPGCPPYCPPGPYCGDGRANTAYEECDGSDIAASLINEDCRCNNSCKITCPSNVGDICEALFRCSCEDFEDKGKQGCGDPANPNRGNVCLKTDWASGPPLRDDSGLICANHYCRSGFGGEKDCFTNVPCGKFYFGKAHYGTMLPANHPYNLMLDPPSYMCSCTNNVPRTKVVVEQKKSQCN